MPSANVTILVNAGGAGVTAHPLEVRFDAVELAQTRYHPITVAAPADTDTANERILPSSPT